MQTYTHGTYMHVLVFVGFFCLPLAVLSTSTRLRSRILLLMRIHSLITPRGSRWCARGTKDDERPAQLHNCGTADEGKRFLLMLRFIAVLCMHGSGPGQLKSTRIVVATQRCTDQSPNRCHSDRKEILLPESIRACTAWRLPAHRSENGLLCTGRLA